MSNTPTLEAKFTHPTKEVEDALPEVPYVSFGDYLDDPPPKPTTFRIGECELGPRHACMPVASVVYGGVDGTKISKENFCMRMSVDEFLQKLGKATGGQVTTDNSIPEQSLHTVVKDAPLKKVWNGSKTGDPVGEDRKPGPPKIVSVTSSGKVRTADNEGPETPRRTPITNIKSASAVFNFFSDVIEKLSAYRTEGGVPSDTQMPTGYQTTPTIPATVPPASITPAIPALSAASASSTSPILDTLKIAAGVTGNRIGSPEAPSRNVGGIVVKSPELPKGTVITEQEKV